MIGIKRLLTSVAATIALLVLVEVGGEVLAPGQIGITNRAEAIIGRPLTPMSYAGVARRTTRRAVGVGAVGVAAGAYYGSSCVQVVDAYGQVVTRC